MKTLLLSLLFALSLTAIGCARKTASEDEEGGNVKATVAVKTTSLYRGDMATIVESVGKIDALRKQKLFSPVAGRVISLTALEGAAVAAGEVLAVIQTKESQAAITGAEVLVRSAKSPEQKAEAQKTLDLAKSTENSVAIRASSSGTVSTRSISEGEFVSENAELFTVIDFSTLVFIADVPTRDLSSLSVGQRATISLQTLAGKDLQAAVEAINPQTDFTSQTLKVRLRFTGPASSLAKLVKTDMTGIARIVTGLHRRVFIVPKSAVLRNDETNAYSIVTFNADSLALSLPVEIVGMTDSTAAITNHGLKEGMNIITEGNYALADSTRITVVR
ncbi:MAG: efflux RND transporter periplasmic adaptor subunit [Ignavibacteriales bacterium]|nr:efflux RND transporter periplasmic adaptor subunit [Ignavibacteriales bacterium]